MNTTLVTWCNRRTTDVVPELRSLRTADEQWHGVWGLSRTSLSKDSDAVAYAAQRPRHSARAAARFSLKRGLLERLRSVLKWFVTEANFSPPHCGRPPQMGKSTMGGGGSSAPPPQS